MTKPTYEEVVRAFAEYVACSNNDGEPVCPTEDDVVRAFAVLERTDVKTDYYDFCHE